MAIRLTGSLSVLGGIEAVGETTATGSFTGSFTGDGSGLTGISGSGGGSGFPHTGSADISGSLNVIGNTNFFQQSLAETMAVGGALSTARACLGGAGIQDAALAIGGFDGGTYHCKTEEYDGSSWSAGGQKIIADMGLAGAGTQNAALAFGGSIQGSCTEEYDGSSWSAGGALITGRRYLGGAGIQDAALAIGGGTPTIVSSTEEYDGSSWAAGGALINARQGVAGAGTQNAGLAMGGDNSCTEEYDGISWSAGGVLITGRSFAGGAGTQNSSILGGGTTTTAVSCTEKYNGTSWSATTSLIQERRGLAGAGTQDAALFFGGRTNSPTTHYSNTEEFNISYISTSTFDYSSTTGDISATGSLTGSFGGVASGHIIPDTNETYDLGSATNRWRDIYLSGSTIDLGGTRISRDAEGDIEFKDSSSNLKKLKVEELILSSGSQETKIKINNGKVKFTDSSNNDKDTEIKASEAISASFASTAEQATTASYAVTASYALNGGGGGDAFPHTGSAIISGSLELTGSLNANGNIQFKTNSSGFSGSGVWSTSNSLINNARRVDGTGIQNAAIAFGLADYGSKSGCTEEYNGTSWSAGGALATSRYNLAGAGTQTAALAFGGDIITAPSSDGCCGGCCGDSGGRIVGCTEEYNGSSWAAGGTLIQVANQQGGTGTQDAALSIGGTSRSICNRPYDGLLSCTEEYDGSSWAAGGALITARRFVEGAGTQNSGLAFGARGTASGGTGGHTNCNEEYNGTSWSVGGAMNRTYAKGGFGAGGTQNDTLAAVGTNTSSPDPTVYTEEYNGTSWSSGGTQIQLRYDSAMGANSTGAGVLFGGFGDGSGNCKQTEEYDKSFGPGVTNFNFSPITGQTMIVPPTTDPGIAGALWNNNGTLSISAG